MAGTSALGAEQFSDTNLIEWDEGKVNEWFSFIGFPQYHQQIIGARRQCDLTTQRIQPNARTDNGISGEILSLLDHEGLKEVGVHSVGQRLTILKEVYYLKVAHAITIEPEHYVPPCEPYTACATVLRLLLTLSPKSRLSTSQDKRGCHWTVCTSS